MIELNIPGRGVIQLKHLVSDVNGTIALDGQLIEGVAKALVRLSDRLELHLITADTQGGQSIIDQQLSMEAVRISPGDEAGAKAAYVRELGADSVVALGQGTNDAGMLQEAEVGICVLSQESSAIDALLTADLIALDIHAALELLEHPMRLVASLRR
jgi:P-type E1-E2 ATPase